MVAIVGFVAMSFLVWLLIWALAGESEAERRRRASDSGRAQPGTAAKPENPMKRAA